MLVIIASIISGVAGNQRLFVYATSTRPSDFLQALLRATFDSHLAACYLMLQVASALHSFHLNLQSSRYLLGLAASLFPSTCR